MPGQSQANRHGHPALTPWWEHGGGGLRWGVGEGFADPATLRLGLGARAQHPGTGNRSGTGPGSPWGMLERVCGGSEGTGRWEAWLRRSCD